MHFGNGETQCSIGDRCCVVSLSLVSLEPFADLLSQTLGSRLFEKSDYSPSSVAMDLTIYAGRDAVGFRISGAMRISFSRRHRHLPYRVVDGDSKSNAALVAFT